MKIQKNYNQKLNTLIQPKKNLKNTAFQGLSCQIGNHILDTAFFRGMDTMSAASKLIKKQFPRGTNVLHLAGSNGEEALTNAMLMNDSRFKILSMDINHTAYDLAKSHVHSVYSGGFDSFLLKPSSELHPKLAELKSKFERHFDPIPAPQMSFNNTLSYIKNLFGPGFEERFFKANKEGQKLVEFRHPRESNILDIDSFDPKMEVGAMYVRNTFYHFSNNNVMEVVIDGAKKNDLSINNLERAIKKKYERLQRGGLLTLGSNIKEHIYIADKNTTAPVSKFCETKYYKGLTAEQKAASADITFYKISPLADLLLKNSRFRPLFFDQLDGSSDIIIPTIWQKL